MRSLTCYGPGMTREQPGVLDALSLLSQVADELVVRTVRDTHIAWADRVHGLLRQPTVAGRGLGESGWRPSRGAGSSTPPSTA